MFQICNSAAAEHIPNIVLVPPFEADRSSVEYCTAMPTEPKVVRVCSNRGRVQFWQHANCSSRNGNANVCLPRKPEELRAQRKQSMVHWTVLEALPYHTFKGILPSTDKIRMSDTVKMKHHAIAIPTPTPAERILDAARQLDRAIKQLPKEDPMDKLAAIELFRKMLLGKNKDPLPINSIQKQRERERAQPAPRDTVEQSPATSVTSAVSLPTIAPSTTPNNIPSSAPNYVSDGEEEEDDWSAPPPAPVPRQGLRRRKQVLEQLKRNEQEDLDSTAFSDSRIRH